jgi:predicted small secreted protein
MPTGWNRVSAAPRPPTGILKDGRARGAERIWSARRWLPPLAWQDILWMLDIFKESIMRILVSILVMMGAVSLSACNTVRGIGQDIEKAGDTIERAANK